MRTDVKVGVVFSLIVVVAAGWYFLRAGSQQEAIPLEAEVATATDQADEQPPAVVRRTPTRKPPAKGAASPKRNVEPSSKSTVTSGGLAGRSTVTPAETPDTTVASGPPAEPTAEADRLADLVRLGRDTGGLAASTKDSAKTERSHATGSDGTTTPERPAVDAPASTRRPPRGKSRGTSRLGRSAQADGTAKEGEPRTPAVRRAPAETAGRVKPTTVMSLAAKPNPSGKTHTVEPGDSLSVLAEIYYGSQRHTGFLLAANPQVKDASRLLVGTVLKIPPLSADKRRPVVATARPGTYLVREGDTFYGIARDVLGKASRWNELLELNSSLVDGDPTNLRVGQVLELPADISPGR